MNATTWQCPACGFAPCSDRSPCPQCGWAFPLPLGDPARCYRPDPIPDLRRDPFETWREFAARIAERPWYVGEATLREDGDDIARGALPLVIEMPRDWARPWLQDRDGRSLQLACEAARTLSARSPTWPVYAWLTVEHRQPQRRRLVLIGPEGELPIQTEPRPGSALADRVSGRLGQRIGHEQRYLDLDDGSLIDTLTGRQWMRCALGQIWRNGSCASVASRYKWHEIFHAAKCLNAQGGFAGYRDWRVPMIEELRTLILCSSDQPKTWNDTGHRCTGKHRIPTLCPEAFPNTQSHWFWSASPYAGFSNYAWVVNFGYGYVSNAYKNDGIAVRLVRGGQ